MLSSVVTLSGVDTCVSFHRDFDLFSHANTLKCAIEKNGKFMASVLIYDFFFVYMNILSGNQLKCIGVLMSSLS